MDVNKENFEKNCCWHFARQLGGSDSGPNEAMGENFKKTPYASLVREAIQNSLDAVDDESIPVTVCFQFKEISSAKFPRFFELKENVDGCLRYYKDNQNAKDKYGPMADYLQYFISHDAAMPYLTVSDSNTKGMDYIEGDTNCPFYAFVQSVGVTSKGELQPVVLLDLEKQLILVCLKLVQFLSQLRPSKKNTSLREYPLYVRMKKMV